MQQNSNNMASISDNNLAVSASKKKVVPKLPEISRGLNPAGFMAQPNTEMAAGPNQDQNPSAPVEEESGVEEEGEEEMEQEFYDDDSQENDDDLDTQTKRVRDKLAVVAIDYKGENQPMVFSYHYKYEKYLRDNNLIDPEKARMIQEK